MKEGGLTFGQCYQKTQEKNEKTQAQETFIPQQTQEEVDLGFCDRSCWIR
jgi:hypothetical protein